MPSSPILPPLEVAFPTRGPAGPFGLVVSVPSQADAEEVATAIDQVTGSGEEPAEAFLHDRAEAIAEGRELVIQWYATFQGAERDRVTATSWGVEAAVARVGASELHLDAVPVRHDAVDLVVAALCDLAPEEAAMIIDAEVLNGTGSIHLASFPTRPAAEVWAVSLSEACATASVLTTLTIPADPQEE